MTLENLSSIGRLKPHKATRRELQRLLAAAEDALADSRRRQNSAATRFDAAYKSLMQCALAALMANGYRPTTNVPGHQQVTIQALPKTIGLDAAAVRVYDGFRRARNLSDYEGEPVEERKVIECTEAAARLLAKVRAWLAKHRPDLV